MRIQPEWAQHQAMWTAWPSHPDLWQENLEPARAEIGGMIRALAKGELVKVLAMGEEAVASARKALDGANVEIIPAQFGDIWLRDTGPIFAHDGGGPVALRFQFNGWGGKYDLPHDGEVSAFIASHRRVRAVPHDFVLEGGSLDFDGDGRVLTTKECLLNANRNPTFSQGDVEEHLLHIFDLRQIVWIEQGLVNDHTDGHVDNVARFVGPRKAVCQKPSGADDPNAEIFAQIEGELRNAGLEVVTIPSPGLIMDEDGEAVAASHVNFIIGNKVVVVPAYEDVYSKQAVAALAPLFPDREVIALPARHVLSGGGSFHCITQQEPV